MAKSTARARVRAPTPRVQAMREILVAFAKIPDDLELDQRSSFETLVSVIDECVLHENSLRKVTIHFLKQGDIVSEIFFEIDWNKKVIKSSHSDDVLLDPNRDIVSQIGEKIAVVRDYLINVIESAECEKADWNVILREDTPSLKEYAEKIRQKYNLRGLSDEYQSEIRLYEEAEKEAATGVAEQLPELGISFSYRLNYTDYTGFVVDMPSSPESSSE